MLLTQQAAGRKPRVLVLVGLLVLGSAFPAVTAHASDYYIKAGTGQNMYGEQGQKIGFGKELTGPSDNTAKAYLDVSYIDFGKSPDYLSQKAVNFSATVGREYNPVGWYIGAGFHLSQTTLSGGAVENIDHFNINVGAGFRLSKKVHLFLEHEYFVAEAPKKLLFAKYGGRVLNTLTTFGVRVRF